MTQLQTLLQLLHAMCPNLLFVALLHSIASDACSYMFHTGILSSWRPAR